MMNSPEEKARKYFLEEYELTEDELNQLEKSTLFRIRVLHHALLDFKQAFKESLKRFFKIK